MATPAYYGTFNFNDGINYFLTSKDSSSMPEVKQTYFKIGRLEGVKKTGETIDEKVITCEILILGTSRADLENKIDAAQSAFWTRAQYLQLHTNDTRQGVADCVKFTTKLVGTQIIYAKASVTFVMQIPFPSSQTAQSHDTGSVTLTLVSGTTYTFPNIIVLGGGNVYAYPTITLTARSNVAWTNVNVAQITDSQTLQITNNLPSVAGDYVVIYCSPLGSNGFSALKNGITICAVSGIFPVIEPTSTSFTIEINASTAPIAEALIQWNARFIS